MTETKIKAVGVLKSNENGGFQVLTIDRPELKPHDILVRVKAVGLNPVDFKSRERPTALNCKSQEGDA